MLSIDQAKQVFSQMGFTETEINKYESLTIPIIDFHKYLMKKLNQSSKDIEKLTQEYSKEWINTKMKGLTEKKKQKITDIDLFKMAGESMKNLAIMHGYEESNLDIIENNMVELSKFLTKTVKSLEEKNK